jgi:hypothetical protein
VSETARSALPDTLEHSHGSSSERVLRHLSILSSSLDWVLSRQPFGDPAGGGSAQLLRRSAPHTCLVRRPSASRSQSYRACFTMRPLVLTNRCGTLVRDQWSILCGRTSRRPRFPRWSASTRNGQRTSFARNRCHDRRVPCVACWPALTHGSAVPRRLENRTTARRDRLTRVTMTPTRANSSPWPYTNISAISRKVGAIR